MSLSVNLEELLTVFESYNQAIWPMQVFAYMAGFVSLYSASKDTRFSNNISSGILSFFWLWTGIAFCLLFWSPVYPAAYAFAGLFILQGLLFFAHTVKPGLSFHAGRNRFTLLGILFILYAMVGYPWIGSLLGHMYPRSLPFGLVPCPITVFTLGMLMLTDKKIPLYILLVPTIWSVAAIVPVMNGIYEDVGLIIAGIVCIPMLLRRDRALRDRETT